MDPKAIPYNEPVKGQFIFPFFCTVVGSPLSGKSTFVLNLLEEWDKLVTESFDYVVWFYGQDNATIANLQTRYAEDKLSLVKGLPVDVEQYILPGRRGVFILDDLMTQASNSLSLQQLINNKIQHAAVSVILLVQDYFSHGSERVSFQKSCHILVLFKNPLNNSILKVIGQRFMPHKLKTFLNICENALAEPHSYVLLDGCQKTPWHLRIRSDIFGGEQKIYIPR